MQESALSLTEVSILSSWCI